MKKIQLFITLLITGTILTFTSCLKKDFDSPPDVSKYDPQLPVNMSIAQLKAKMSAAAAQRIDSNWTVYGIVTADDRSGNFYKQITIEDSTGGITILIDANSLYTKYPVGRKVYLKVQGLWYGYYNKLPQIGGIPDATGSLSNIPATAIDNYIIRATYPNPVPVTKFTNLVALKVVNVGMLNRLVEIENVQVVSSDTSNTYAEPPTVSSGTNIEIEDCNGNKIIIRTSGYANFQSFRVPKGKGTITALYTTFGTTPQLVIRDTSDLKFYEPRCGAGPINPGAIITIDSLKKKFTGSSTTVNGASITGIVISDRANGNMNNQNLVLQQGNRGIVVRFTSSHSFNLGDSLVINVDGATLSEFSGLLQVSGTTLTTAKATRPATGKTITPQTVTIAQLNGSDFENYESTLVRIVNATASGGATFTNGTSNTSRTLTDPSGSITLFTYGTATFGSTALPAGAKTWTGIVGQFNTTKQFMIRNPATDIQ